MIHPREPARALLFAKGRRNYGVYNEPLPHNKENKMQSHTAAQKRMSVGTLLVALMFVVIALAFASYITVHDIMPAVHNFLNALQQHPSNT